MLATFGEMLTGDYRMTLVARNAGFPEGSRDLVITEDKGRAIVRTVLAHHLDTAGSEAGTGSLLADRMIAISAFRYALSPMTDMPGYVINWLLANQLRLSRVDRDLIVREIDEAAATRQIDGRWSRLRDALRPASGDHPTAETRP